MAAAAHTLCCWKNVVRVFHLATVGLDNEVNVRLNYKRRF